MWIALCKLAEAYVVVHTSCTAALFIIAPVSVWAAAARLPHLC